MREQLLNALKAYYTGHIEKSRINIENLIMNSVGVAEHPDYIETISKEMASLANYDEQLQMVSKYFKG
jgi:hypothetical protein